MNNVVELKVLHKWYIREEDLVALRACVAKQSTNAQALGTCEWEAAFTRERYLSTMLIGSSEFYASLGRLDFEHHQRRASLLDTIKRTEAEQREIGTQAITKLGLPHFDEQKHDIQYTIRIKDGGLVVRFRSQGAGSPCWDEEF